MRTAYFALGLMAAAVTMVMLGAAPAQADHVEQYWEGWEPKRTLPTPVIESLDSTAFKIIGHHPEPSWSADPNFTGMGNRTTDVERWRPLVEEHFEPGDVPRALDIMRCESGGNPYAKNPTSTASGLFQHLKGWWGGAWGPAFDPFDPNASVENAARLRYLNGGWSDWYASRHCWA